MQRGQSDCGRGPKWPLLLPAVLLGLTASPCSGQGAGQGAGGQGELALRRAFEGKQVRVKMEMPGTHDGVDVYYRRQPAVDFRAHSQRMKRFGLAIANQELVRVTTVRVKGKNIEFQLNGGGYGTAGDDSGSVSLPFVSKSRRESDLEKLVKEETNPRLRDSYSRELAALAADREREQRRREVERIALEQRKREEILERRRTGGSRFNIWFPERYLSESIPTPEQLMELLADYVDFTPMTGQALELPTAQTLPDLPATNGGGSAGGIRRGMLRQELRRLYGAPKRSERRREGSLDVDTETYENNETLTEVELVNEVVIRFRVSSK